MLVVAMEEGETVAAMVVAMVEVAMEVEARAPKTQPNPYPRW